MDSDWKRIGKIDPYWGVLSSPEFHTSAMSNEARAAFFRSGDEHIRNVLAAIRRLRPYFQPKDGLDFGCGVGRLIIPMALEFAHVVGVDVSEAMLAEARKNSAEAGVGDRIELRADVRGEFNFVHSYIVFQHIPEKVGLKLVRQIAKSLQPGGAGMLHFHYWRDVSTLRRFINWTRPRVPAMNWLVNIAQGKHWRFPLIMMERYNLNAVIRELHAEGVTETHGVLLDSAGSRSILLYLFKDVPVVNPQTKSST